MSIDCRYDCSAMPCTPHRLPALGSGVILVVPIVLMNLVTAIIVNTALEHAVQDKEVQQAYEDLDRCRCIGGMCDGPLSVVLRRYGASS